MATILVIDDNHAVRRLASKILTGAGHTVHEAEDGRRGLACLRKIRPDLVVTDMIMPDAEGIETIRAIRSETPTTPILAISGSGEIYLRLATQLGATAALEKPFAPEALRQHVNDLLAETGTPLKPS
jgi:two-component system chemotaxis response regulator CheY